MFRAIGYVDEGQPVFYSDSLQTIGLEVNSGNFASQFSVKAGAAWTDRINKTTPQEQIFLICRLDFG